MTLARTVLGIAVLCMWPAVLHAQQNKPRMGYVYPAGGRQGTSFDVTIGGQYLDGVSGAHFVGKGVQAELVDYEKPVNAGQAGLLRDQLKELMERKVAARRAATSRPSTQAFTRPTWTEADDKKVFEITKKLATFQRRTTSQAIAEIVTLRVTVAADAQPGIHEFRLSTQNGMTNPLGFELSRLPEITETEARGSAAPIEVPITLPTVANGQIMPGDVDRYRFVAKKGQHIVAAMMARQLIPYIADAVPGWFQATLALKNAAGEEIAFVDDYRFSPDPVLHYEIKRDGEYVLEIRDSIYRGREDFVYRVSVGELPFVSSVFPLGGPAGKSTMVDVAGWNLPVSRVALDPKGAPAGIAYLQPPGLGQSVPFAVSDIPDQPEREGNDSTGAAQAIVMPTVINGRIGVPSDIDVFRFEGASGQQVVAEVLGRRLNSPLDSMLRLVDSEGKQIAANDDFEDKASGLNTHHADSYLLAKLPATGTYYLLLSDAQEKGGSEYAYRLRVSQPRPDFALRVVPSSLYLKSNSATPLTVYALRQDGYAGDISLAVKQSKEDYKLSGAQIPRGQDSVKLTLTASRSATTRPVNLQFEGKATVEGKEVVRTAVPADDWMQAFAYHHLVPTSELEVVSAGRFGSRIAMQMVGPSPVKIPLGKTTVVRFNMPPAMSLAEMEFKLADAPDGISIEKVVGSQGNAEITILSDGSKSKVGQKGNLIVNCYVVRKATTQNRNVQPWLMGALPAIPFEILR